MCGSQRVGKQQTHKERNQFNVTQVERTGGFDRRCELGIAEERRLPGPLRRKCVLHSQEEQSLRRREAIVEASGRCRAL